MYTMERYVDSVLGKIHAPPKKLVRFEAWLQLRIHGLRNNGHSNTEIMEALGEPELLAVDMMNADVSSQVKFAGVFRRVPAFIVDMAICCLINLFPFIFVVLVFEEAGDVPPLVLMAVTTIMAMVLVFPTYFSFLDGSRGRTLGKRLLGLRVVRDTGAPISFKDAVLRTLFLFTPFVIPDLVTLLFHRKRKRLADIIAGTSVIREIKK